MYDVVIAGAGIAGSYLASRINPKYSVLILEQNRKVIPKDSGIVSTRFDNIFGGSAKKLVKFRINKMECVSPSGHTFSLQSDEPYAYILRRKMFGRSLRKNARKNADISYETVESVKFAENCAVVKTKDEEYRAKIVVGCDGTNSVVRRAMNIENPKVALGIMVKTRQKMEGDISVFFNKYFSPDFFSWIIPQNNEYGIMTCVRPKDYFDYFVKKTYLPPGKMYAYMIPYTYTKSYENNALLIGDACGQNKPLTGGGIMYSMMAAQHAADVINSALKEGTFSKHFLSSYEKMWKKDIAWEIEKQYMLRMIYRKLTNKEIDGMFKDFGYVLSMLDGFDYDKLSDEWKKLPKFKLARFLLPKITRIIGK